METATVKPIRKKRSNQGIIELGQDVADSIGADGGEVVRVVGGKEAFGRAHVTDEMGIVRMDGSLRYDAATTLGADVDVAVADADSAESVLVSIPDDLSVSGDLKLGLEEELSGAVVWEGARQTISLTDQHAVPVIVEEMAAGGPAIVTQTTNVDVTERVEGETTPVTYDQVGGLERELDQIREMVELPIQHPELFERMDVDAPNGIILHGPPGTGKTLMAKAVANESDSHFESISGPEIVSKFYGESEGRIREVFERAQEQAPAIIFIDELDSIAPKRDESDTTERRIVAQLLALMDGLEARKQVTVIAATNRLDGIDPALRRPGRFDREVEIGVPNHEAREQILSVHTRNMPLSAEVDIGSLAEKTHGFVGADLANLARESAMHAIRRVRPNLELDGTPIEQARLHDIYVEEQDIRQAMRGIEPSALREVFVETPDVTWEEVGGLEDTKSRVQEAVEWPQMHGDLLDEFDVDPPSGILLFGPPGTGKTLMAKAVANESESNFISVKGPELLDKYVGESEKGVREIFSKARENAPTVLFFDELDAIASSRGDGTTESVTERVVSQLLTELDGLEALEDVTVVATTNRPDLLDSALLRPGRLDRQIHVPVPDSEAREEILRIHTRDMPLSDEIRLNELVSDTDGFVGADLEALCREASIAAVRERVDGDDVTEVSQRHFDEAMDEVGPSVSDEARSNYEDLEEAFQGGTVEDTGESEQLGASFM